MKIRKTVIVLHRDLGYFFAVLTMVYAVSGIAVNHVDDWNPNYVVEHEKHQVGSLTGLEDGEIAREVLSRMGIEEKPKAALFMGPDEFRVFLDQRTLFVSFPGGEVLDEQIHRRPFFFQLNFLHLNHAKNFWTWYADLYALALLILALTGIFVIPGKKGIKGRGGYLLAAGVLIPVVALVLLSWDTITVTDPDNGPGHGHRYGPRPGPGQRPRSRTTVTGTATVPVPDNGIRMRRQNGAAPSPHSSPLTPHSLTPRQRLLHRRCTRSETAVGRSLTSCDDRPGDFVS